MPAQLSMFGPGAPVSLGNPPEAPTDARQSIIPRHPPALVGSGSSGRRRKEGPGVRIVV